MKLYHILVAGRASPNLENAKQQGLRITNTTKYSSLINKKNKVPHNFTQAQGHAISYTKISQPQFQ